MKSLNVFGSILPPIRRITQSRSSSKSGKTSNSSFLTFSATTSGRSLRQANSSSHSCSGCLYRRSFCTRSATVPKLLVVDGQQRLSTLAQFYDGKFRGTKSFRLQGVHPEWQGRRYQDLSEEDRIRLDDSTLRSIVVQQLNPRDRIQHLPRFRTTQYGRDATEPDGSSKVGLPWTRLRIDPPAEPRRGLEGGPWDRHADRRLRDEELLLRVLALATDWTSYGKPMKAFLTAFMEGLGNRPEAELEDISRRFSVACRTTIGELGQRPFHLRGRLNVAALDGFLGSAMQVPTEDGILGKCFAALVKDPHSGKPSSSIQATSRCCNTDLGRLLVAFGMVRFMLPRIETALADCLEHLEAIRECDPVIDTAAVEAYLARHLVVLLCAEVEASINSAIIERVDGAVDDVEVANLVKSVRKGVVRSARHRDICEALEKFSGECKERYSAAVLEAVGEGGSQTHLRMLYKRGTKPPTRRLRTSRISEVAEAASVASTAVLAARHAIGLSAS